MPNWFKPGGEGASVAFMRHAKVGLSQLLYDILLDSELSLKQFAISDLIVFLSLNIGRGLAFRLSSTTGVQDRNNL